MKKKNSDSPPPRLTPASFMLRGFSAPALLVGALVVCPPVLAGQRHPLAAGDLPFLHGVDSPRLSPRGDLVAYVRSTTDYDANRTIDEIVVVAADNGTPRDTIAGTAPRWSPDGRAILYSATRGERSGLWVHTLGTSGDRFVTRVDATDAWLGSGTVKNAEWSPDGAMIAFVGAEGPPPTYESDVRAYSRIMFKTRTGLSDNRRTHIYVVSSAGGSARLLTPGHYDEHSLSWSPDGKRIAFVSDRSADPDNTYSNDLWTVDVSTGRVEQITRSPSTEFHPFWSPDGRTLAYTGWRRPRNTKDSPAEDAQIFLVPANGCAARAAPDQCQPTSISRNFDRRVTSIAWSADGNGIYFTASDRGSMGIYRLDVRTRSVTALVHCQCTATQYSLDRDTRHFAYVEGDVTHPPEVYVAGSDGSDPHQVTHEQDVLLSRVSLQPADSFWFDSWDGAKVEGWIMRPASVRPGERVPVILSIHGGPHGMFGWSFSDAFQALTGRGYAVVFINPRGSSGYGQRFADGTLNNWGGGDYQDLMAGLDYALAHNSALDRDRMGVIGISYGGYMTNWVITQTNRFKAAVASASLSNLISFYGTSLYTDLVEAEFNGMPWDNYSLLWQWSPLAHVARVTTPTLFLHGEADHDVPIEQAEEMYTALRKLGVDATLVRYPNEGHGIREPQHVRDYHQRIADWLERYLRGAIPAGP